jgi:hypothetical protein
MIDHGVIGWYGVDWIGLAQVRDQWRGFVYMVLNLHFPAGQFLSSCTTDGLSRIAKLHSVS